MAIEFNSFSRWSWTAVLHTITKYCMDLFIQHRTPLTYPIIYGKILQQSLWYKHKVNQDTILTARVLTEENSAEIHYKTFEKLLRFEQNISEYNLFSDTFVYRRFKCRNTFVQKFIYTDNIYYNPLCSYLISWRETQSGIPDCY